MSKFVELLLRLVLSASIFQSGNSLFKVQLSRLLKKLIAPTFIAYSLSTNPHISFAEVTLSDQLKTLQSSQITSTKIRLETEESQAIARGLQYSPGYLIGRGIVSLSQDERGDRSNPYGVPEPYLVDSTLDKDETTLFVLAVGREGPPLAAKKFKAANKIEFPLLVEITCDDLLFPYTTSAWEQSTNRNDAIAMTAIVSSDGLLSTASPADRLGFGQSEPTNVAGVTTRTTAAMVANKRIDLSLYSKDDLALLSNIDEELDRRATASVNSRLQ